MLTVIHTTHDRMPEKLKSYVLSSLWVAKTDDIQLLIVDDTQVTEVGGEVTNRAPLPIGKHKVLYRNILDGLARARGDIIYCHAEADCLYPPSQWQEQQCEPGVIYYTRNMWRLNSEGAWPDNSTPSLSGMVADHDTTMYAIRERYDQSMVNKRIKWAEPGKGDDWPWQWVERKQPYIDVRWGGNITGYRESENYHQEIPYWGDMKQLQERLGL